MKASPVQTHLSEYILSYAPQVEANLENFLPVATWHTDSKYNGALRYALFSGGKRFRPALTLLGAEIAGGKPENVFHLATAAEFIHTSSLIFDDLPCMDDSAKRRGKDSLHLVYGEGLAILVAIGLLNASYELAFVDRHFSIERILSVQAEIVESIGANGMVGGQSIDIAFANGAESTPVETVYSETLRNLKTSSLFRLSLRMGAIAAGATTKELRGLSDFAVLMGNAYQIRDDLIDQEEDGQKGNNGVSYQKRLKTIVEEAKSVLILSCKENRARTCLLEFMDNIGKVEKFQTVI